VFDMVALGGFVIGYLLGAKAGPEGLAELADAWNTIRRSDEVRGLVSGFGSMVRGALGQGRGMAGGPGTASSDGGRKTTGRVRAV
jgi:hypothetical protein